MSKVFVLDTHKQPLNPVHPGRARILLSSGQAALFKRYPFTIILKAAVEHPKLEPLRLKLDPGSKTTGIAIVNDTTGEVVFAAELSHRGHAIQESLDTRRAIRRSRRQRKTRYRKPRFDNRHQKKKGWLPPSFEKGNLPLQIEHIHPRSKGGTDRVSNLTLACEPCNIAKGTQDIKEFLAKKPEVLKRILAQCQGTLKDATAVNAMRWELFSRLQALGLPLECGSGGLTKFNRLSQGLDKAHWIDAACVGKSTPPCLVVQGVVPLLITAHGSGNRQMCRMDKYGFPRTGPKQAKHVKGFQTGDMVRAEVLTGKKVGTYVGRVAVRTTGSFTITTKNETVQGISHRFCTPLQHCDGYSYQAGVPNSCPKKGTHFLPHHSMGWVSVRT